MSDTPQETKKSSSSSRSYLGSAWRYIRPWGSKKSSTKNVPVATNQDPPPEETGAELPKAQVFDAEMMDSISKATIKPTSLDPSLNMAPDPVLTQEEEEKKAALTFLDELIAGIHPTEERPISTQEDEKKVALAYLDELIAGIHDTRDAPSTFTIDDAHCDEFDNDMPTPCDFEPSTIDWPENIHDFPQQKVEAEVAGEARESKVLVEKKRACEVYFANPAFEQESLACQVPVLRRRRNRPPTPYISSADSSFEKEFASDKKRPRPSSSNEDGNESVEAQVCDYHFGPGSSSNNSTSASGTSNDVLDQMERGEIRIEMDSFILNGDSSVAQDDEKSIAELLDQKLKITDEWTLCDTISEAWKEISNFFSPA